MASGTERLPRCGGELAGTAGLDHQRPHRRRRKPLRPHGSFRALRVGPDHSAQRGPLGDVGGLQASSSVPDASLEKLRGNRENTEIGDFIRTYLNLDLQTITDILRCVSQRAGGYAQLRPCGTDAHVANAPNAQGRAAAWRRHAVHARCDRRSRPRAQAPRVLVGGSPCPLRLSVITISAAPEGVTTGKIHAHSQANMRL